MRARHSAAYVWLGTGFDSNEQKGREGRLRGAGVRVWMCNTADARGAEFYFMIFFLRYCEDELGRVERKVIKGDYATRDGFVSQVGEI